MTRRALELARPVIGGEDRARADTRTRKLVSRPGGWTTRPSSSADRLCRGLPRALALDARPADRFAGLLARRGDQRLGAKRPTGSRLPRGSLPFALGRSCSSMAKRWSTPAAWRRPSGCSEAGATFAGASEAVARASQAGSGAQRGARLLTLALTSRSDDPAQCRLCRRTILNRNLAGVGSLWPLATARTLNL